MVRVAQAPADSALPEGEAVVEDVAGPNEEGTGWNVTVRIGEPGSGDLVAVSESALETTGLALDEKGDRVPVDERPGPEELRDRIEMRLFTALADGIAAARVAEAIEGELLAVLAGATVAIVAERHWSEPYNYEFAVTVEPLDDADDALSWLALVGDGGWIASRDDGWRFDLWWSGGPGTDSVFLTPDVHGVELSFLPWRSPQRRPESERPLVNVLLRAGLEDPPEASDEADAGFDLDAGELDVEPGDEES